jgi:methylated-DNA-[protein]-cysteine S-methyltransferase
MKSSEHKIIRSEYSTRFGELILASHGDKLVMCDWKHRKMRKSVDQRIASGLVAEFMDGRSDVMDHAIQELEAYLEGDLKTFQTPLNLVGTEFQIRVWKALEAIPHGTTLSYQELSSTLGDTGAIRAVAAANGANALSIFIPCHRIIGSDGSLVGYSGGLNAKRKLLSLEGALPQKELDFPI